MLFPSSRFGFNPSESFVVPSDVADFYEKLQAQGTRKETDFNALFATYEVMHTSV